MFIHKDREGEREISLLVIITYRKMNNADRAVLGNFLMVQYQEMRTLLDRVTVAPASVHYIESLRNAMDELWFVIRVLMNPFPEPVTQQSVTHADEPSPRSESVSVPNTMSAGQLGSGRARGRHLVPFIPTFRENYFKVEESDDSSPIEALDTDCDN